MMEKQKIFRRKLYTMKQSLHLMSAEVRIIHSALLHIRVRMSLLQEQTGLQAVFLKRTVSDLQGLVQEE